ncbi:MAG: MMPL family transporter [bacterium]|nr:MMPL family transporter [bacterium]
MAISAERALGRGLARWVAWVGEHGHAVLAGVLLVTCLAGGIAAGYLGVNSETDDLFDANLPFRQDRARLDAALPARNDNLLVVIDAPTSLAAGDAAASLVAQLEAEPAQFASAFAPGSGPFFERNGLLFLELEDLEALADDLAAAQPLLAEVWRDPTLRGLFRQLTRAIDQGIFDRGSFDFDQMLSGITAAIADAERREARPRAFGELVLGGDDEGPVRRFVIVEPKPDYSDFVPGRASVGRLQEILVERGWNGEAAIRARMTGDLALKTEELGLVKAQAAGAGIASFVLVGLILWRAQRSGRLIAATLLTLAVGLVWTAGFAAVSIGHLNVISVAFAVLFIGLGVDFGIHLTLRYRELREGDQGHVSALSESASGVGSSIVLCAITTAVGFYSFVPTDFLGVAELGVISGTGMLFSLVGTFVVLPAWLGLGSGPRLPHAGLQSLRLPAWPTRFPRAVVGVALLLAVGAMMLVPRLRFDANSMRVRDPNAASVKTFFELLDGGDIHPWSIEVLTDDLATADALAVQLEALPSVERTSTLSNYVPSRQEEKLELLADIALFLGFDELDRLSPPDLAENEAGLRGFREALAGLEQGEASTRQRVAAELGTAIDRFLADLDGDSVDILHESLVQSLLDRITRLELALGSDGVELAALPPVLQRRMIAADGRAVVEVYPENSLNEDAAVAEFVREVRSLAPGGTGTSPFMVEAGEEIKRALRQAMATAAIAVALMLLVLWRSPRDALLALAPLALAALLTGAVCVLVGLPINFANVIVVPLLLGIGVDSGIHLVHRFRAGVPTDGILGTSTSRAVFWSALTTIASFGSLGLASHRGLASLGQLLTLGVGITLACNLIFLPALLTLVSKKSTSGDGVYN